MYLINLLFGAGEEAYSEFITAGSETEPNYELKEAKTLHRASMDPPCFCQHLISGLLLSCYAAPLWLRVRTFVGMRVCMCVCG